MGRLLVSPDLTADEIPATGGHRRFVPGPVLGEQRPSVKHGNVRHLLGGTKVSGLLALRKPGKIREGKRAFPSDSSPAFSGCEASGLAAFSRRARSTTAASWSMNEVQEMKSPGSGVQGAEEAPCFVYVHSCVSPGLPGDFN